MYWLKKITKLFSNGLQHSDHPIMQQFMKTETVDEKVSIREIPLLVADLEMTGLDPKDEHIVSIGWVVIDKLQIEHGSARHVYINNLEVDLDKSAPIHKISHAELATGVSQEDAIAEFLKALAGKVLVLHHAPIDMGFLNSACAQLYGVQLDTQVIDTMEIERRRLRLKDKLETSSVRLNDCRERYKLPPYRAHNAALDALATAELLLAQISHGNHDHSARLTNYLS